MKPGDLYHTGIVVEDFDAAMTWFAETAGYRWCEPYAGDQNMVTPEGEITVPMRITYSMDEPRLELLQAVAGTVWTPSDSGVHHLGYWSDDVDADLEVLFGAGLSLEVKAPMPDGRSLWAYCESPTGARVELVSRVMEPALREWFTMERAG
jgi:glyoxalase/bleomycin resistance protein/dioxygenase superfamily protein